jgi:hypothetical protein
MENLTIEQKDNLVRRRTRQEQLDDAHRTGRLTLDNLLAISPVETSIEHHQTLRMQLQRRGEAVMNAL